MWGGRAGKSRAKRGEAACAKPHGVQPKRCGTCSAVGAKKCPLSDQKLFLLTCHWSPVTGNWSRLNGFTRQAGGPMRMGLALVAGLLLASAFPRIGVAGFAWV